MDYHTRSGTATEDVDYTGQSGTLTFNAGETEKVVNVPVIDDTVADSGETFYLVLSTASGAPIAIAEATGTIYNDDPPPNLSVADAEGTEGDYATLDFVVTLNPAVEVTATVDYATSDGTATAGEDYTAKSGTLTFLPGQTTKTVAVPITNDEVEDDGETVTLTLSNASGETISDGEATGTIRDSNGAGTSSKPLWSAHMTVADYENGNFGAGSADLLANQGGTAGLTAKWLFYDSTRRELNLAFTTVIEDAPGLKLWMNSDVLAFSGGDSGITILGVEDMGWEDGDTMDVWVTSGASVTTPSANTAPTGAPTITGTAQVGETLTASTAGIGDADGLDDAVFSYQWLGNDADISGATGQTYTPGAADAGKTLKVRVAFTDGGGTAETLTSAATGPVAARSALSVADADATEEDDAALAFVVTLNPAAARSVTVAYATADGTATAGDDYTSTSGTLTFAVGDTSKTVSVPIADDAADDGGETLTLTLSNATVAEIADASATGTIGDDDANTAPTGAPTITGTAQVGETLTASTDGIDDADGMDDAEFSHQWIVNDGNADADIADATAATYTPVAGDASKTLKVRVTFTDDGGTAETLTSAATGQVASRSALSVADAEATEEDDAALGFVVTLDPAAARSVTVEYATADGTATAGDDYTATSGTLTFAVGDTSKTVSVPIADDSADDGGETVTLTLSNATVAEIADASATGTIGDDDANTAPTGAPTITGTAQVGETLTASTAGIDDADGLDDAEFSYQWIGNDGSDADIAGATGQTYTPGANDVGKTLKVRVTFTDDGGTAETLTSAATGAVAARSALSVADAQASEEDDTALEFVVTLSPAAARTVTVDYATADGTATAGADYTATSGTLTFAVGDTSKTVSVPIADDTADDGGETVTLTLTNAAVATISDASATGTISNEESGPPLTASFSEVPESHTGARFTFVLTFSEAPKVSYRTLRDVAFDVTDGTVRKAKRRTSGSNLSWDITVEPAGTGAVAIELPATPDCTATGAICTGDGRALSNSASATVAGASTASAVVNGPVLTLSWPTPPDGFAPPGGSDFAVSVDGDLRTVSSASFLTRGVMLHLAEPVLPQQSVVVDHLGSAMHPLRSAAGDLRAPWRDMPALNVSGWTADELSAAGVDAPVPGVVTTVWERGTVGQLRRPGTGGRQV